MVRKTAGAILLTLPFFVALAAMYSVGGMSAVIGMIVMCVAVLVCIFGGLALLNPE